MRLGDGSEIVVTARARHMDSVRLRLDAEKVRVVQPTSSAV